MNPRAPRLGQLPTTFGRDAIHMAVIPVVAAVTLEPGQQVSYTGNKAWPVDPDHPPVGVVDPFLPNNVKRDERFWLLVNPATIKGLRHDWTHDAFPGPASATDPEREESEQWLHEFIGPASAYGSSFDEQILSLINGEGATVFGREERSAPEEFWFHLDRFCGFSVRRDGNEYFDCRC